MDQTLERKKCFLPVAQSGLRDRATHLLCSCRPALWEQILGSQCPVPMSLKEDSMVPQSSILMNAVGMRNTVSHIELYITTCVLKCALG